MKKILLIAALAASLAITHAQENVPREQLLKVALAVSLDLKQMLDTPIPTDPDVKRPVAVREGDRGCMVLPESKLSIDSIVNAGKEIVPVGQLWLRNLVPQCNNQAVEPDKLRTVTVALGDKSETAILCALGVHKSAEGKLELLVYGKEKEALLHVPLKPMPATTDNPIELSAQAQGEGAVLTLELLGKYTASFTLAAPSVGAEESFQGESIVRLGQAKQWALACIMFADDHASQLPTSFEQMKAYVRDLSYSNWEIVSGGNLSGFTDSSQNSRIILLREKQSRKSPAGDFVKGYAFVDGHAESIRSPNDDFPAVEKEHGFLVRPAKK